MPDDLEPFLTAIKQGDAAAVAQLLEEHPGRAAATDGNGISAVMLAVYCGKPEVLPPLLRCRPELTLWEACAVGDGAEVARLLAAGPGTLNEYSADGWTPLHLAAFFGKEALIPLLLAHGAAPDSVSRNEMNVTPLQSALASRREGCARRLIESGADVNGGASKSWPPLVYCAANHLRELAVLLLESGANPHAPAPDGRTALDVAVEKGHSELAEILRPFMGVG